MLGFSQSTVQSWEVWGNVATVIGAIAIAGAGAGFALDRLTARREFYAAYDERFNNFLSLCLADPKVAGLVPPNEEKLIEETAESLNLPEEIIRHRWLLMSYLLSTLEATYFMMTTGPKALRVQFSTSYEDYVRDWIADPVFAAVYESTGGDYGSKFSSWMEKIVGKPGGRSNAGSRENAK